MATVAREQDGIVEYATPPDQFQVNQHSEPPVELPTHHTMGRRLADGTILEQTSGTEFLVWRNGEESRSREFISGAVRYLPVPLHASVRAQLRQPAGSQSYPSLETLVDEFAATIAALSGLDAESSLLAAAYVAATWVADALPSAPLLTVLSSETGGDDTVVSVLGCLCRRAVSIASADPSQISSLPPDMVPTLVLLQPPAATLPRLLAAVSGGAFLRKGQLERIRASIIVRTEPAVEQPSSACVLAPGGAYCRITDDIAGELCSRFAPRLLRYRLQQLSAVAASQFDAPQLSAELRVAARTLGSALEGSPALQARLVRALDDANQEILMARSQSPTALVLEAVLALQHEGRNSAHVGEVADMARATAVGRGIKLSLSDRAVGGILRRELHVTLPRDGAGYRLDVAAVAEPAHRVAARYGVLTLAAMRTRCGLCAAQPSPPNATDVHDLHDVHRTPIVSDLHHVHNVHIAHAPDSEPSREENTPPPQVPSPQEDAADA